MDDLMSRREERCGNTEKAANCNQKAACTRGMLAHEQQSAYADLCSITFSWCAESGCQNVRWGHLAAKTGTDDDAAGLVTHIAKDPRSSVRGSYFPS